VEFTEMSEPHRRALAVFLERPPAAAAGRAKRVLLVDEDEELRTALQLRFESSGFEVLTAMDGLEALQKGRVDHPDLILMDVALPNLTGLDVCRLLRGDPSAARIPIILFSASHGRQDGERCRRAGAEAFLPIPFNGQTLMAKVDELLLRPSS